MTLGEVAQTLGMSGEHGAPLGRQRAPADRPRRAAAIAGSPVATSSASRVAERRASAPRQS
jgi:hypothetical protein